MKRSGFFLMEIVVYILSGTLLVLLIMQYAVNSMQSLKATTEHATRMMSMSSALDVLCRDLAAAPAALKDWKVIQPLFLVWRQGDHDIGWIFKNTELIRCEGLYYLQQGTWHSVIKSVAAHNLQTVKWAVAYRSVTTIRCVQITATDIHGTTQERLCALHGRNNA